MPSHSGPALYGLSKDNSSRIGDDLWGKNDSIQFNFSAVFMFVHA